MCCFKNDRHEKNAKMGIYVSHFFIITDEQIYLYKFICMMTNTI